MSNCNAWPIYGHGLFDANSKTKSQYGCFLKWWYPTTMGFPTKNDQFGVFWGYHHFWKHPIWGKFRYPQTTKIRGVDSYFPERVNLNGRWEFEAFLRPPNQLHVHSPSFTWNLRVMVSKFGISYSFWCHFQVNHVKLWEGKLPPAFFVDSWRSSSTSESLEGRTKRFSEGTMCAVFIFSIYIYIYMCVFLASTGRRLKIFPRVVYF